MIDFQKSLSANVRRTSLNLLRKIVDNIDQADLKPMLCDASTTPGVENLVNVVVSVLDQEDDLEGQEQVLMILSSLLKKDSDLWVNELVRLGVFERVEAIAKPPQELFDEKEGDKATSSSVTTTTTNRELTPIGEEQHAHSIGAASRASAMSVSRSTASTPSVQFDSERETLSNVDESERMAMLNTMLSFDSDLVTGAAMETPPPTVEVDEAEIGGVPSQEEGIRAKSAKSLVSNKITIAEVATDKTELVKGTPYRWKEWRIVRGDVSLFAWNDVVLIELNLQSNGWFQFLMDGELWMVWNGGVEEKKEGPVRLADGRAMIARWRESKSAYPEDMPAVNILTSAKKMEAGSWQVWCTKANEILLKSIASHAKSVVSLKDDTGAVVYDTPNRDKRITHTPTSPLPVEFHTGWSQHGTSTKRRKLCNEIQRRRVQSLAWELWTQHLKEARTKPREVVLKLQNAAVIIHDAVMKAIQLSSISRPKQAKQPRIEQVRELVSALQMIHEVVVGDCRLSTFEFSISGIIAALHELLALAEIHPESYPARMFKEAFSTPAGLSSLLQKLISVLESTEKFPQYLYDIPGGSSYGLQLLSRRLRMKLEMASSQTGNADPNKQQQLIDRTGKLIKSEPLATVGQIKSAVLKMVARQWYERERHSYAFVKAIQEATANPAQSLKFIYTSDFDDQGVIYWLGTNGRTREWTNPGTVGVVKVISSDNRQPFGKPEDILSRDISPLNCHTSDDKNANFTIDLGVYVYPTSYTLRHARGYGRSALRNWLFQGSKDKQVWEMLVAHLDDASLGDPGSTATWPIEDNQAKGPFRYFRIAQNGKNSSNQTYYLSLSGFEIYGQIVDVVVDGFAPVKDESKEEKTGKSSTKDDTKASSRFVIPKLNNRQAIGVSQSGSTEPKTKLRMPSALMGSWREIRGWKVVRGPDWRWDDQDGQGQGRVVSSSQQGWVEVVWDNGYRNSYRYGVDGKFDVKRIDPPAASSAPPSGKAQSGTAEGGPKNPIANAMLKTFASRRGFGQKSTQQSEDRDEMFTFGNLLKSKAPAVSTASTPLSRFTRPVISSAHSTSTTAASSAGPSGAVQAAGGVSQQQQPGQGTTSQSSAGTTIGKKSMSTTNLVDERHSTGPSVASTGQAASAESLQHQTPSLENLLAKANTHAFGRIAETQESGETEGGRETPHVLREAREENEEDENETETGDGSTETGTTASSKSISTDESRSADSSNADVSIYSSRSSVLDVTPRDTPATPATLSGEKANNSLSVSAPDLAARQRQQSSEASSELDNMLETAEAFFEGSMDTDDEDNDNATAAGSSSEMNELPVTRGDSIKDDEWHRVFEAEQVMPPPGLQQSGSVSSSGAQHGASDRSFLERVRDVLAGEDSNDPIIQGLFAVPEPSKPSSTSGARASYAFPHSTSSSTSGSITTHTGRPDKPERTSLHGRDAVGSGMHSSSLKQTIGKYADVLKGIMQSVMDTQSSAMEMEELMDEDEFYEDEDGNEDDVDEDLAQQLGIPVETFATVLRHGARDLKLNWKQLSQYMMGGSGSGWESRGSGDGSRDLRSYDDEVVIKCQFQSLIPAFDPRPGRANVNQIQEVELPSTVNEPVTAVKSADDPSIRLYLRGPNLTGVENVTVAMTDDDASFFKYVQILSNQTSWSSKSERSRRIWEPTYTLIYEDATEDVVIQVDQIEDEASKVPQGVNECLETIGLLSRMQDVSINPQVFISDKLTMKLTQELSDALVVAARALPEWCSRLVYIYPCLFSVETRNMYLQATGFGVTRTIVWLQSRRDAALDRARGTGQAGAGSAGRPDRYQEYRVGRLKTERIKVSRAEDHLMEQAIRVMKFHSERKSILEIDFTNEEGTGLGPTLEFYALVAAELQKKSLAIWLCDDADEHTLKHEERELDLGEGKKPPGYYVRRSGGLFPAPLPPHTDELHRATELFRILGIFLAKEVHPVKGNFLKELRALAQRKRAIESEPLLDRESKRRKIDELKLCIHGTRCRVEDLALNFTVNPSSKVYGYEEMELVEGGADMDVTMDNVELYVQKVADFYLQSGIMSQAKFLNLKKKFQMRAFREGFDRVFPLKSLRSYSSEEVQRLLSGEQCPEWTREDVMNYTEPKLGYSRDSPGFLRFVDVMVGMNAQERKNFLQFATGCSSLPPGGLANLHPRLTVVRKVESGDGSYPSVNTCVHYLKLPEYSSVEILRERLLTAINEKGFHLN
ncbi:hypothetical protein WR25_22510 isoform C [Diploscapter pachys]|uniref:E3 ubiquitin-protein ligase n=1 Tax=Diploscapter pachys TaxID=2018661 RepID=A0A2A2JXV1_9BILA|nr:hypothetical protein WR25_22510 isoform A [Diploscapter pachys]PAV66474.1 hypothetical protein WR25_22510 isoform B [Diploscapter pachys]PAV66475.1 hypothetical protein WR25_22510 isoform C [Diploscapter pachys]